MVAVVVVAVVVVAGQRRHLRDGVGGVSLLVALVHAPRQLLEQRAELAEVEAPHLRVQLVVVVHLALDAAAVRRRRQPDHRRFDVNVAVLYAEDSVDETLVGQLGAERRHEVGGAVDDQQRANLGRVVVVGGEEAVGGEDLAHGFNLLDDGLRLLADAAHGGDRPEHRLQLHHRGGDGVQRRRVAVEPALAEARQLEREHVVLERDELHAYLAHREQLEDALVLQHLLAHHRPPRQQEERVAPPRLRLCPRVLALELQHLLRDLLHQLELRPHDVHDVAALGRERLGQQVVDLLDAVFLELAHLGDEAERAGQRRVEHERLGLRRDRVERRHHLVARCLPQRDEVERRVEEARHARRGCG